MPLLANFLFNHQPSAKHRTYLLQRTLHGARHATAPVRTKSDRSNQDDRDNLHPQGNIRASPALAPHGRRIPAAPVVDRRHTHHIIRLLPSQLSVAILQGSAHDSAKLQPLPQLVCVRVERKDLIRLTRSRWEDSAVHHFKRHSTPAGSNEHEKKKEHGASLWASRTRCHGNHHLHTLMRTDSGISRPGGAAACRASAANPVFFDSRSARVDDGRRRPRLGGQRTFPQVV